MDDIFREVLESVKDALTKFGGGADVVIDDGSGVRIGSGDIFNGMQTLHNGEWFRPQLHNHLLACCTCGTTHKLNYRFVVTPIGVRIEFQAFFDKEATAKEHEFLLFRRSGMPIKSDSLIRNNVYTEK